MKIPIKPIRETLPMIEIKVRKNDLSEKFILSSSAEINYKETKDWYILACDHRSNCMCRRLEKINKILEHFKGVNIKNQKTIITLTTNIKLSNEIIEIIDKFHDENRDILLTIIDHNYYSIVKFFHTAYQYEIRSEKFNSVENFTAAIQKFIYSKVKLPDFIIEKVGEDIRNEMSMFSIDFDKYTFSLIEYNEDSERYTGIFQHKENFSEIVISNIVINENNGTVYYYGNKDKTLKI